MGKRQPSLYREVQPFRQWPTSLVLAMPPAAIIFITCRQWIWHHPWGNPPVSNGGLLFLAVLLVLVYVRLITVRLVTDLRPGELRIRLRGLWRSRKIRREDVRAAKAVLYDAIRDFGGYGFRSGWKGKAYIARGIRGVEIELQNGRKVLIGSQRPDELASRIMEWRVEPSR